MVIKGGDIMYFDVKELGKLQKQLKQMEQNALELDKTNFLSFSDLFTSSFMNKYTSFSSFEEFLEAGEFTVNSKEDFEAIPDSDMYSHVSKTTKFSSWEDMFSKATENYISKKLGF